jgi:hypothetical protein
MKEKSLDDNNKNEKLVLHNEMNYEVKIEESMIQKSKVGILVVSTNSADVSTQSTKEV